MTPGLHPESPDADWLALEYALGVLDAAGRRDAEARLARDPAFTAEVDAWAARLAPFIDEVAEVEPSPALWRRIQAAVGGGEVIELAARRVAARESAERLNRGLSRWRGATLGVSAAAAVLALLVVGLAAPWRKPAPPVRSHPATAPPPLLVAELDAGRGGYWIAAYDPIRRIVLLQLPAGAAPAGRSAELWLIGPDGKPRALGVSARAGVLATLPVPGALAPRMAAASVLAVSIEPPGGSPTDAPTGPVVAKGALRPV